MNEDTVLDPLTEDVDLSEDSNEAAVTPLSGTARLILKRGGVETDISFPFTAPAVVGRFDPTVGPIDIDLGALQPEGGYISRKHAKLVISDGVWMVEDLGSANGTFILADDFEKVETAEIVDGSEIAFGNARFVFRIA